MLDIGGNVVRFLARKTDFPPKHPDQLWDPPSFISSWYWASLPHGYSRLGTELTTCLHLVLRLRMNDIPPFPHFS